jgi:hypothetical protein
MRKFAASLSRPFHVRYNPFTESIDILDRTQVCKRASKQERETRPKFNLFFLIICFVCPPPQLRELALHIQSEMSLLTAALSSHPQS